MARLDLTGDDVERREQCGRAMALVVMTEAPERASVGQLEIALRPLERLDAGLFVDRQNHGVVRRVEVEGDDVRRFGGKSGVGTDAPTPTPLQMNAVPAQHPPYVARRHIPHRLGHQAPRPARVARRRRLVQARQYPPLRHRVVAPLDPGSRRVRKTAQPRPLVTDPPLAHRRRPHPQRRGDVQIALPIRRRQDHPCPERHALLALRRPDPPFQRAPVVFPKYDGGRSSAHAPSYFNARSFASKY